MIVLMFVFMMVVVVMIVLMFVFMMVVVVMMLLVVLFMMVVVLMMMLVIVVFFFILYIDKSSVYLKQSCNMTFDKKNSNKFSKSSSLVCIQVLALSKSFLGTRCI